MKKEHSLPKLHKAASTDDLRYVMQFVKVNDEGIAIATDGHILVMADITEHIVNWEKLKGRLVHREAWKVAEKGRIIKAGKDYLEVYQGNIDVKVPHRADDIPGEAYPNYNKVLPAWPTQDNLTPVDVIGIDPDLVNRVRLTMNVKRHLRGLQFYFYGANKPIVANNDDFDGIAVIMPQMLTFNGTFTPDEDRFTKYIGPKPEDETEDETEGGNNE